MKKTNLHKLTGNFKSEAGSLAVGPSYSDRFQTRLLRLVTQTVFQTTLAGLLRSWPVELAGRVSDSERQSESDVGNYTV